MGLSLGLGLGIGFSSGGGASGPPTPQIQLSASTIAESASIGTTVGVLSVSNGSGTYTFTETADPDTKFAVSGSNLNTAAALDYETATSHSVTIQADNGVDTPFTRVFTVTVTDVVESTEIPWTPAMIGVIEGYDATNWQAVKLGGGTPVTGDRVTSIVGTFNSTVATPATPATTNQNPLLAAARAETTYQPLRFTTGELNNLRSQRNFSSSGIKGWGYALMFAHSSGITAATRVLSGISSTSTKTWALLSSATLAGGIRASSGGTPTKTVTTDKYVSLGWSHTNTSTGQAWVDGEETTYATGTGDSDYVADYPIIGNSLTPSTSGANFSLYGFWYGETLTANNLTRANMQRMEGYAHHRLGLPLPVGHPYEFAAPTVPAGTTSTIDWIDVNPMASGELQPLEGLMFELRSDGIATGFGRQQDEPGIPYSLTGDYSTPGTGKYMFAEAMRRAGASIWRTAHGLYVRERTAVEPCSVLRLTGVTGTFTEYERIDGSNGAWGYAMRVIGTDRLTVVQKGATAFTASTTLTGQTSGATATLSGKTQYRVHMATCAASSGFTRYEKVTQGAVTGYMMKISGGSSSSYMQLVPDTDTNFSTGTVTGVSSGASTNVTGIQYTDFGRRNNLINRYAGQRQSLYEFLQAIGYRGALFETWTIGIDFKTNDDYATDGGGPTGGRLRGELLTGQPRVNFWNDLADCFLYDMEDMHGHATYPIRIRYLNPFNEGGNAAPGPYGHLLMDTENTPNSFVSACEWLRIFIPKMRESAILSTWGGQPNYIKFIPDSWQGNGAATTFFNAIKADVTSITINGVSTTLRDQIDAMNVHYITDHANAPTTVGGVTTSTTSTVASNETLWKAGANINGVQKPAMNTEYGQYFGSSDSVYSTTPEYRMLNSFLNHCEYLRRMEAPTYMQIHAYIKAQDSVMPGSAIMTGRFPGQAINGTTAGDNNLLRYPWLAAHNVVGDEGKAYPVPENLGSAMPFETTKGGKGLRTYASVSPGTNTPYFSWKSADGKIVVAAGRRDIDAVNLKIGIAKLCSIEKHVYALSGSGNGYVETITALPSGSAIIDTIQPWQPTWYVCTPLAA